MTTTSKQLQSYLDTVSQFIIDQGARVVSEWDQAMMTHFKEGGADVSTNFDEEIELRFAELVEKKFPEHGFKGEEFKELNREAELTWHIDPIDGTKYFARGIPFWNITVSLVQGHEPLLGLIYNPVAHQIHYAYKGGGAFVNRTTLKVSSGIELKKAQIVFDFPLMTSLQQRYEEARSGEFDPEVVSPYDHDFKLAKQHSWEDFRSGVIKREGELRLKAYRVRDIGSAAYSLAWLTQGLFAGYVVPGQPSEKFVDVAAGLLIAQEAGASVYRRYLSPDLYQLVVASDDQISGQLRFMLNP